MNFGLLNTANLIKYVLEGLAVALAAFYIPKKTTNPQEVAMIALTAAATFFVLDNFSPAVAAGTRQGSGFGIGQGLVQSGAGSDTLCVDACVATGMDRKTCKLRCSTL